MPIWSDLVAQFDQAAPHAQGAWLQDQIRTSLALIASLRGSNVIFYASAFLQKPRAPFELLSITGEDVNGFMTMVHQMDCSKPLTLLLHTPGGVTNAAESIVAYLRSKFANIEVVVPTHAMSAGTMLALASERILMGRQSQLGPIDPQMPVSNGGQVSARAVVEQFEEAKKQILGNPQLAHAWAPVLQSLGPALLMQAKYALAYGEQMVAKWLAEYMFKNSPEREQLGRDAAEHFNDADKHKSHGRRIDREEARTVKIKIEELEASQALQDAVLTAYHLMTIAFEKTPLCKAVVSNANRLWVKNWAPQQPGVRGMP